VLYDAGGQALLDTFPASTFFVTAVAGYVCLQAKPAPTPVAAATPNPAAAPAPAAATPMERALAKLPNATVLSANWAVALLASVAAAASFLVTGLPPPARLVGVVSIPAATAAAALALSAGPIPEGLGPLFAFTGLSSSGAGAALPVDARRTLHQAVIAYGVAMVSLVRGHPFGLINLLDVANTAGPLLLETEHLVALAAWCFVVLVGVVGLMKTPKSAKKGKETPTTDATMKTFTI
jgi:hypothetical protein